MTTATDDLGRIFTSGAAYADDEAWHMAATRLRNESPIYWLEQPGWPAVWVIMKHADIMAIERRHDIFKNTHRSMFLPDAAVAAMEASNEEHRSIIHMDDPDHKRYRSLTTEYLTAGALRKNLQQQLAELATYHVDRMAGFGGRCDFAWDIAKHYPLRVILAMLGVPDGDHPKVLRMADEINGLTDPEFAATRPSDLNFAEAVKPLLAYLGSLIPARRQAPASDLASVIANSQVNGEPIGDIEALHYYAILATAGHETTSATMGGGLDALVRHPKALDELRDDPSLIGNAVEEMLRWTSPVKGFTRLATEDFELRGTVIRAGDRVLLSWPSANRDEDVFADPFTFDIHRPNANRNIAFGFGKHYCLGAELARMELRTFFTELLSRLDEIEIAGPVERVHGNLVSGVKHLPIRYTWRA